MNTGTIAVVLGALAVMFLVQALKHWPWFNARSGLFKFGANLLLCGVIVLIVGDPAIQLLKDQAYLLILPMLAADLHTAKKHGSEP